MLPFSDSILKLSSVPALSAERIRGRALPPDPRGPSERSLVKPRRSPSSGLLRSEVVGFPPSALSKEGVEESAKKKKARRLARLTAEAEEEAALEEVSGVVQNLNRQLAEEARKATGDGADPLEVGYKLAENFLERWQSWVPARPARPAVRVLWVQNDAIARADRRVLGHETRGRGRGAFNHERRHNHQSGTTEEARISRRVVAEKTDRDSTASSTAAVHRQLQTVG